MQYFNSFRNYNLVIPCASYDLIPFFITINVIKLSQLTPVFPKVESQYLLGYTRQQIPIYPR